HDYRYFPDPDLPPLVLSKDWIKQVCDALPELPAAKRDRFVTEYALGEYDIDVLTASPALADYFEGVARQSDDPKAAANWIMGEVLAVLNATGTDIAHFRIRPADLAALIRLVHDGIVSHSAAKQIFAKMVETGDPPKQIAERDGLVQERSADTLAQWVNEVLAEHPAEAERFRNGEKKLLGVLVGMVMRKSKGRADPRQVNQLLSELAGG
ncbi:MAG TPA: Asp-tRNA(Asn)/Glu-tRNA(Gln) amidotransferase GatCAB subunit B, partial [Gemmatimonadaceae bacterium]|nr:Asp-tRNA(Asn)/Glu-tRNA(Gln) amidotransferase GatCAB subunit B [Gemmatimonadaceae bacterium]